jgi:transposase
LPNYGRLTTLPGVGVILGLTIAMETGPIDRFGRPGEYASYCRTVDARRLSNEKKKGDNNQKCGNKYLAWAWVEAANFAKRYDEACRKWFDRKARRKGTIIATKALACKLAKAGWYVMAKECGYEAERMFPELKK